jgi:hypothetical protein
VKRWVYSVLAVVVIAGILFLLYRHMVATGEIGSGSQAAGASSEQGGTNLRPAHMVWQIVDHSPEGFKVEMPAETSQVLIPAYNAHGGVEQIEMVQASPGPETTFAVAWADDPPVERASSESADKTLDSARDGALARTQSTLVNETHSQFDGYPARDFSARNENGGVLNARLVLAGTHLYMLVAAFPGAGARRDADVNRFFDSFHLIAQPHSE